MKIPDKAKTAFDGNMQSSSTVELPFPAPPFYIVNGNAQLAALNNFQYFGGWACNTDRLKFAADEWQGAPFPIPGLVSAETVLDNGNKLPVLAARSLLVAPIGMRQYSSVFDHGTGRTQRVAPFTPGARPGIQVLCVLGYKNEQKAIQAWAPVMLTTKGYQVNNVQKAFSSWQKTIKPLIKKLIPDAPPSSVSNLFWMSIGTFGQERKQELVGSGQQRKPITPISAWIPENLDEAMLERLYVGDEIAEWMADLSEQAQDWLKVFENLAPAVNARSQTPPLPEEPDFDLDPIPATEDEIPF
jgi:hypothetical protein